MTDDSGRREPRQFEPPPWERGQFEEIARRKAQDEAESAGAEARRVAEVEAEPRETTDSQDAGGATAPPAERPLPKPVEKPAIDERRIAAMLIELSGEEGPVTKPFADAGRVAAIAFVAVGAMMLVLAVVLGMRATIAQGRIGAVLVGLLGALVAGFAAWMWARANREQGS